MSCVVNNNVITVTRGDTINLDLQIKTPDGLTYEPCEDDRIRFVMKRYYNDQKPILEKELSTDNLVLRIESEETKTLKMDVNYYFDVELTLSDGTVDTIISSGIIKVKQEVD